MDSIKEWASMLMLELLMTASCIKDLKRISAESSVMFSSTNQSVKGLK